jgi:Flp pilus assembly protein TadG
MRRPNKRERGLALVEFALTLPLFLVLVLGMVEYGYYFYVAVSATNAAREGARQCTLVALGACGNCNPTAAVDYMSDVGLGDETSATATCANVNGALMYTVDVTVDFATLTGYPPVLGAMPASGTAGNTVAYGEARMRGQ